MKIDPDYFAVVHDFRALETVLEILRSRVGSPVSYSSIAKDISENLVYFHERYKMAGMQLCMNIKRERKAGKLEIRDAFKYLKTLKL